jgi:predicted nuclease with TOPRIM domain
MDELERKASAYKELSKKSKEIDAELAKLKEEIVLLMDGAETVRAGIYTVKNTHYEAFWFDKKALEEALPDVAYDFTKVVDRTRFTVA